MVSVQELSWCWSFDPGAPFFHFASNLVEPNHEILALVFHDVGQSAQAVIACRVDASNIVVLGPFVTD